jgi:glutamate synthase (NADPH/NADH) small chain
MSHKEEYIMDNAEVELARLRSAPVTPKVRMQIPPQDMPAQDPSERRHNMDEVALGYTPAQAMLEAERCLQCKNAPCIAGCPVRIDIPGFIGKVKGGDFLGAGKIIKKTNLLPSICGRVCPQETQCQAPCTVGKALHSVGKAVQIGRLERFVADYERTHGAVEVPNVASPTG